MSMHFDPSIHMNLSTLASHAEVVVEVVVVGCSVQEAVVAQGGHRVVAVVGVAVEGAVVIVGGDGGEEEDDLDDVDVVTGTVGRIVVVSGAVHPQQPSQAEMPSTAKSSNGPQSRSLQLRPYPPLATLHQLFS